MVVLAPGRSEHREEAVADELVDMPAAFVDHRDDQLEQAVEGGDNLGCGGTIGKPGEVPDVEEHHRHLQLLAGQ